MQSSYLAPAKINLYLGVHSQLDERGYHKVDSIMAETRLCDVVHAQPAAALSVAFEPAVSVPPEKTAVFRAAAALAQAYGREPNVAFTIERHVPVCAGLGGASADAAAVLVALCDAWGIERTSEQVQAIARSIGADVPFFLFGGVAYLAGGGDELVERYAPLGELPLVLVRAPGDGVSTPAAYAEFDRTLPPAGELEALQAALRRGDAAVACGLLSNNLQPVAFTLDPSCAEVAAWLAAQTGVRASMLSGSGSAVFAICDSAQAAAAIAGAAEARGWWSCATTLA